MKKIILVHGAWADGSNWRKVIPLLKKVGTEVHAAQIPLTSFQDDVKAVTLCIEHLGDDIVLVGHSYAGAVITAAGSSPKVSGLVFITAYAPEEGETVGALRTKNPAHPKAPALRPDSSGFVWMNPDGIGEALAHDVTDVAELELIYATQKPISANILGESMGKPAWRTKPSWYLVCENDRMTSPLTQSWMAERAHSKITVVPSGHMPLLSHPEVVAQIIIDAARPRSE
jgi:pimeloyl-ACP methyl ester carboxylesterase